MIRDLRVKERRFVSADYGGLKNRRSLRFATANASRIGGNCRASVSDALG
jgi:hypothetical protein